ncbi:MAG: tyrosine-type recombinase/integrase, partial [Mycobacteriales bacterium]
MAGPLRRAGRRTPSSPRTFATKTEAGQYLAGVEADLSRGQWRLPAEVTTTVTEWGERFLAAQSPRLAVKTVALYSSLFTSCITPTFGNSALPTIRKIDVREWVAALSARPLSPSRVRQAHGLLSQILASAVDDDLLKSNPCTGVRTPRLPVTEPRILTPEDVARLAAAIRPPFGLLVELLAYGGLRIGEAFALRRRSLDELHKRLMIEESLSETGGRLTFGPTKTHQARAIALPDFLVDDLLRHLSDLKAPEADALLFTGRTGRPLHYNAFRTSIWDAAALK